MIARLSASASGFVVLHGTQSFLRMTTVDAFIAPIPSSTKSCRIRLSSSVWLLSKNTNLVIVSVTIVGSVSQGG